MIITSPDALPKFMSNAVVNTFHGWAELQNAREAVGAYMVEEILLHRRMKGCGKPRYEFLVRWEGFDAEDDTWEPESNVSVRKAISFTRYAVEHPDIHHLNIAEDLLESLKNSQRF